MDIEEIRAFCLSLPFTTEDVKWGNDLAFCVGKKMFTIVGLETAENCSISFKCTPEKFAELVEKDGIIPAPYVARYHWVAVEKAHAQIVNIAVDGEASPYAADKAEREKAIAYSKHWIDAAVALGSPSLRTNIPEAKDSKPNKHSKPDLTRLADSLARVADYATTKNIVVNLENDNPVTENPFFLVQVIEKVNSPWLRALPDFANSVAGGIEHPYEGIDAMFAKAYCISHVKEMEADSSGKLVHADLAKTFGFLKQHAYQGYCSIEWDSPGDPYQGTADLIEKTVRFLG